MSCVDKLNKCEHQLSEEWSKLQQKHIEENLIPVIVIAVYGSDRIKSNWVTVDMLNTKKQIILSRESLPKTFIKGQAMTAYLELWKAKKLGII